MSSDVMRVRLHLRGVRVLEVVADSPGRLEVAVEAAWSWSRCPHCGFKCRRVHDRRVKRVWDQPVSGRETVLLWRRRRWRCENCAERHLEDHPEFEGKVTRRLARRLVGDVAVMPISAAARRAGVSWHLVNDLVRAWAALVGAHRRRKPTRVLLVDETSMRRRHRYVTVIVSGDTGELLAMVPHRSTEALSRFFAAQGHRWCAGVKVVVTDGSKAYRAAVDRHLATPPTCWTASTSSAGSRRGSPRCAATSSAASPQASHRSSTPTCSGARFLLLRRPDRLDDDAPGSKNCSRRTRACAPPGRRSASCTACNLADDKAGALAALDRSPISTRPATCPSTTRSSTRCSPTCRRSSPGTPPGGPATAASKAPTTSSKSYAAPPHGFTNPHNFARPRTPRDMMHPTDTSRPKTHVSAEASTSPVRERACPLEVRAREVVP